MKIYLFIGLFICSLFNDTLDTSDYMATNNGLIRINMLERTWMERPFI